MKAFGVLLITCGSILVIGAIMGGWLYLLHLAGEVG